MEGRCLGPTQVGSRFLLKGGHFIQPQGLHPQSLASSLPDREPPSGQWVALCLFQLPLPGGPADNKPWCSLCRSSLSSFTPQSSFDAY